MKKILYPFLGILFFIVIWYFFIKQNDYTITFKAKTTPGTIVQTLETWNISLRNAKIISTDPLQEVHQQVLFGDSIHIYDWQINKLNDSLSQVTVGIKDPEHSFTNKLELPFSNTAFKKRSISTVKNFYTFLQDHLKQIKITVDGLAETPSTFCAYLPLKTKQLQKAKGMMENYNYLSDVLMQNQVQLSGTPFLEVTQWNQAKDSIAFNFCFPIIQSEKLPMNTEIKYKKMFAKKAVKATYNGNYITSDRAWYALLAYAKSHKIPVDKKPIEVFYNNPNMGGNELQWKAEIFMPLKQ